MLRGGVTANGNVTFTVLGYAVPSGLGPPRNGVPMSVILQHDFELDAEIVSEPSQQPLDDLWRKTSRQFDGRQRGVTVLSVGNRSSHFCHYRRTDRTWRFRHHDRIRQPTLDSSSVEILVAAEKHTFVRRSSATWRLLSKWYFMKAIMATSQCTLPLEMEGKSPFGAWYCCFWRFGGL